MSDHKMNIEVTANMGVFLLELTSSITQPIVACKPPWERIP